MSAFTGDWLPFHLGSLPHTNVRAAWDDVLQHYGAIPAWPQLPHRAYLENMYVQFSERFPGITLRDERMYVDRRQDLDEGLEQLYLAYLEDDLTYGQISPQYALALAMLRQGEVDLAADAVAIKGQVTGPISWGLTVVDQNQRPILYDEVLADAVGKHLRIKAAWQERELARFAPRTIMMIDEPYMASFGSAFVALSREQVIGLLEEVFAGLRGIKGVHCCGNTDWSILLNTSLDILSLDAYDYAEPLALYPDDVKRFLSRGGIIAWGIVPTGGTIEGETVASLVQRLHEAIQLLVSKGVPEDALLSQGMVTASCGLGSLSVDMATRVMDLCSSVSAEMRQRYSGVSAAEKPSDSSAANSA
jgi:hypothetical protein